MEPVSGLQHERHKVASSSVDKELDGESRTADYGEA
jgi:hypothetical protein